MKKQPHGWSLLYRNAITPTSRLYPMLGRGSTPCRWALDDYRSNRENGDESDNPSRAFPEDGRYSDWVLHHTDDDGSKYYHVKYDEGPGDRAWMQEKDRNYLARLQREKEASPEPMMIPTINLGPSPRDKGKKKPEALAIKEKELAIEQQRLELEKLKVEKEMLAMKLELAQLRAKQGQSQEKPPERPEVSRTLPDTNMSRMSSDTAMSGSRDEGSTTKSTFFKG